MRVDQHDFHFLFSLHLSYVLHLHTKDRGFLLMEAAFSLFFSLIYSVSTNSFTCY